MSIGRPVKVIAVTGGKGGVGKTNVSVNLGIALAELGRRVVLMDADLGLANVDVLLGLQAEHTLADVISGEKDIRDILIQGPGGIQIVPSASGVQSMTSLSMHEHAALVNAFNSIQDQVDVLLIDTAAGISETVTSFVKAAQEAMIVVCDEPSSITDAYALIKLLQSESQLCRFHVIANMTRSSQEGQNLFKKLETVCARFLDVALIYAGHIPFDENIRKAVQQRVPFYTQSSRSRASNAIRTIAKNVDGWPPQYGPRGNLEFFFERLLQPVALSEVKAS